jgi:hypothetical protein
MWQGMTDVAGSREGAMMGLKKAFGQYNYAEDPEYQRDMQYLQQNPTQQTLGAFYEKWGDQLDGKTIQDVAQGLNYVEGTNPWYENQIMENELTKSNVEAEYTEPLTKEKLLNLQGRNEGLGLDNEYKGIRNEYAPTQFELELESMRNNNQIQEQNIDANAIRNKYLEPQLKQQLTAGEIANDISRLEREYKKATNPIRKQLLENDLQLANETLQDKIALVGLQVDNSKANLRTNRANADVAEQTAPYEIQNARTNALLNALGLEQEQSKWDYLQTIPPKKRYGGNDGNSNEMAIDIKEMLPTPEGVPQLALNSADTVVYAQTGRPYVDSDGNAYVAQKDVFGSNRTFVAVNPNNYLSGGSDVSDFRKTGDGDDEPSWGTRTWNSIVNNITGGGDNQTQQQSGSAQELYQQFKQNTPTDEPLTPSQIKQRISLIDDERFEQMYGIPKSQFEDFLNRF